MSDKKYELIKDGKLFRIKALKDFGRVKAGDLGGLVESENNLSHNGHCWITEDAMVTGKSAVYHDAAVTGRAKVYGSCSIFGCALVTGNAEVFHFATVGGESMIQENAQIGGHTEVAHRAVIGGSVFIYDNVFVGGRVVISGNFCIHGGPEIQGDAIITDWRDFICIGPCGSNRYITVTLSNKMISAGCFHGTLKEFKEEVHKKYGKYDGEYNAWVIPVIENYFKTTKITDNGTISKVDRRRRTLGRIRSYFSFLSPD